MGALAARNYDIDDDTVEAIGPVAAHNGRRRSRRSAADVGTVPGIPAEPRRGRDGEPSAQPTRREASTATSPRVRQPATRGTAALAPERMTTTRVATDAEPLRVAPPAPVPAPRALFVFGVVLLVVIGIVGLMVLNTKINENSFRLHDLRKQQANLDAREQQLDDELVRLNAPGNLAAAARRLGLVPAGTPAFIRLPDGRVLGVPKPAKSPVTNTAPPTPSPGATSPGQGSGDGTPQRPPGGR